MPDYGQPVVSRAPLTEEEFVALRDCVAEHGRRRRARQKTFNEVDFLCGAMAVFFAVGWADKIPANWIFGPLMNRSILEEREG